LLSALIDGTIEKRRDLTAGGAKFRTYALIGESGAHTIDSLAAIRSVCFEQGLASLAEVRDAMRANFVGHESLRAKLLAGPKYGNDDPETDALGRALVDAFTGTVRRHAAPHEDQVKCPCGMGTFSWYVGIGQGLGASPDGRRSGEPVSSNFSPALGRDVRGIPSAILSYSGMPHIDLAAGGPLDLRLPRHFVPGAQGTEKMKALVRGFVDAGGAMLTLTVADTEELLAAQQEPDHYRSLRVRMGGWCAFFTLLSLEQQDHQIRRQGGRLS
jgi:formate C-acetyltransferase